MEIELVTLSDLENLKKEMLSEKKKCFPAKRRNLRNYGLNPKKYSSFWAFHLAPFNRL